MKKMRVSFYVVLIIFGFDLINMSSKSTENLFGLKAYAQSPVKKKEIGIVPKVADPTTMGWWKEDKSRVYTLKDAFKTYIYSQVYAYDPDGKIETGYGFFRVVSLNRLEFAVRTNSPYDFGKEPPMKIVKEGVTTLVVLYDFVPAWDFGISVYRDEGNAFIKIGSWDRKPIFEDLDGDGSFETLAYRNLRQSFDGKYFKEPVGEYEDMEGKILAVYRYMSSVHDRGSGSYFMRLKGRDFEKYFMEHARKLIEKKYPKWLEKGRASSFDIQSRRQLYRIIEGWLATVESTQNVELIKEALDNLRDLPWPSVEEKKKILEKVIERGYPGLSIQ